MVEQRRGDHALNGDCRSRHPARLSSSVPSGSPPTSATLGPATCTGRADIVAGLFADVRVQDDRIVAVTPAHDEHWR